MWELKREFDKENHPYPISNYTVCVKVCIEYFVEENSVEGY